MTEPSVVMVPQTVPRVVAVVAENDAAIQQVRCFAHGRSVSHSWQRRTIVVSEEVGVAKPDPAIFQRALGAIGAQPAETLFVGDNSRVDKDTIYSIMAQWPEPRDCSTR